LQDRLLLAGASHYGLADPIQNVSISLLHISICLLRLDPDFESIVQMQVMSNYVQEICPIAVEVQKQIENEESKLSQVHLL